jgi:tRNA 2-thiouridine synthesizing protein A
METTIELDTRGLNCPLPCAQGAKGLAQPRRRRAAAGAGDRSQGAADFAQFCESAGHVLVESSRVDDHFVVVIEKRG